MTNSASAAEGPVRFGVLGGRSFIATNAVLPAIDAAHNAELTATASRSGSVPEPWAHATVADYDDVLARDDVDAVYLPLPNGMHEEWTRRCAEAGKHVLCEKPLASDALTARRMAEVCAANGVLLAEAWMTPFGDHWQMVQRTIDEHVGELGRVEAAFRFTIGPDGDTNYRWDAREGGGALLDVGIYALGVAADRWGAQPDDIVVHRRVDVTKPQFSANGPVDGRTDATLTWAANGTVPQRTASISVSFIDDEEQSLTVTGPNGQQAFGADMHGGVFTGGDPYRPMVEAFADAVRGVSPWPRPTARSIELLELLDRIQATAASGDVAQ